MMLSLSHSQAKLRETANRKPRKRWGQDLNWKEGRVWGLNAPRAFCTSPYVSETKLAWFSSRCPVVHCRQLFPKIYPISPYFWSQPCRYDVLSQPGEIGPGPMRIIIHGLQLCLYFGERQTEVSLSGCF